MSKVFADDLLAGKVAYIAGGTRGMNLAIAKRYAAHGAKVTVMSRNPERCAKAQAELEALGTEAMGLPADARDYDRVAETMAQTAERFGPIDIVVAGQAGNFYAPVNGMSSNGFKAVIDIDLVGTFNVWKASYEHLRRPGASLIAITAPEAVRPLHFQAHVCAAKAGVNMLMRVLALEWGPKGVRVNGISPGPIEGSWGMANVASPNQAIVDKITAAIPLKRWGQESDIADTALFLASPASSYITGTIIETDGGVTIASPEGAEIDSLGDLSKDPRVRGRG
jgi:NAD(P)-dependent dehydrogenase (short-subunit alcohol dehydrogenase family)